MARRHRRAYSPTSRYPWVSRCSPGEVAFALNCRRTGVAGPGSPAMPSTDQRHPRDPLSPRRRVEHLPLQRSRGPGAERRQLAGDRLALDLPSGEAGPRATLLTLARQCGLPEQTQSLALCRGPDSDGTELLSAAAALLRSGYSPNLSPFYGSPAGPLQRIAPFVFDTSNRFWFSGGVAAPVAAPPAVDSEIVTTVEQDQLVQAPRGSQDALMALIADVGSHPTTTVLRSSRLGDDLGYDSLLQMRLLNRLRSEYRELEHIAVSDLLPHLHSVGALVDFITARIDGFATGKLA